MISTVLVMLAAAGAAQSDTTRTSREAFTNCLREFVDSGIENQMARDAFQAEYPRACGAQEAAFRAAVIARETSMRATRANAEEMAGLEIEDARMNFSELFEMAVEDQAQAQPQPQPQPQQAQAEQPQAPAAQPASAQDSPEAQEPQAR